MADLSQRELTPSQRMALVVFWLARGTPLSTSQAAQVLGVNYETARQMFMRLSGALPVYCKDGMWRLADKGDEFLDS